MVGLSHPVVLNNIWKMSPKLEDVIGLSSVARLHTLCSREPERTASLLQTCGYEQQDSRCPCREFTSTSGSTYLSFAVTYTCSAVCVYCMSMQTMCKTQSKQCKCCQYIIEHSGRALQDPATVKGLLFTPTNQASTGHCPESRFRPRLSENKTVCCMHVWASSISHTHTCSITHQPVHSRPAMRYRLAMRRCLNRSHLT